MSKPKYVVNYVRHVCPAGDWLAVPEQHIYSAGMGPCRFDKQKDGVVYLEPDAAEGYLSILPEIAVEAKIKTKRYKTRSPINDYPAYEMPKLLHEAIMRAVDKALQNTTSTEAQTKRGQK